MSVQYKTLKIHKGWVLRIYLLLKKKNGFLTFADKILSVWFNYPCEFGSNSRRYLLKYCLGIEIINEEMECLHPFKKMKIISKLLFQETLYLEYSCKTCEQAFILIKLIIFIFVIKLKTHPIIVMNLLGGESPNNINFIFTSISGLLVLKYTFLEFIYC